MQFGPISSLHDVTRLSLGVTLIALSLVTALTAMRYPREDWPWEILVAWPVTILLAYGTARIIGAQMLRVHALNEEVRHLASRDRLTGVATRDHFFDCLADRPRSHGIFLRIDIDRFKLVNDTHGQLGGDKVIRQVSRILSEEAGARDIVCRFGGEEFAVFLENATQVIAREVAERCRARVAAMPLDDAGKHTGVTLSIGASLRRTAAEFDRAIREADAALGRAKSQGRDRIVLADGDLLSAMASRAGSRNLPAS